MNKKYETVEQGLGLGEGLGAVKGTVWKVAELSPRGLITTSGRMGVNTLDAVIALIIADYGPRSVDWVVTYDGTVVKIIHPDDSVTTP